MVGSGLARPNGEGDANRLAGTGGARMGGAVVPGVPLGRFGSSGPAHATMDTTSASHAMVSRA